MNDLFWWGPIVLYLVELTIKLVALGTIPTNRRPSSSLAWLLLIFVVPILGLLIFLLIGSPFVRGRRAKIQAAANQAVVESVGKATDLPEGVTLALGAPGPDPAQPRPDVLSLRPRHQSWLVGDEAGYIKAMAETVDSATERVHVEFFILSWDDNTDEFFQALVRAVKRGVKVRLLYDHVANRRYPKYKETNARLTAAGIEWYPMMPIQPLKGRWRRPDLRNHRKLLVVDGTTAFMGSQNIIAASYLLPANLKVGRTWHDLNIKLTGEIVRSLEMVFAIDWYTETGERLRDEIERPVQAIGGEPMQLVPSGPGYLTLPNLRLFTAMAHRAQERLSLTSPYFVPDESLLEAITTAAHRGVAVELFVSEEADQFVVQHAQASYYEVLLEAGVRIWLYPKPTVLHAKHFTVDDIAGVIGSSNMDFRSFGLDYEISLLGMGREFVADLQVVADKYRAVCRELTLAEWAARPRRERYVENVMRLMSALQ